MTDPVRVPVGAGTPEGVNSAYYLPERGVVVDPGPPTEPAWNALVDAIGSLGTVEHVFATHWHSDHAGLACRLAEAAGATIHMHSADAPLVGDYAAARERRLERDLATLRRWGVPENRRETLRDADSPSAMPETYPVTTHEEGETVAGLEVLHTPGHTLGHASFACEGTLLLGDLLLPTYTPNVGGSDTRTDDPLAAYLASIDQVNARFETGEPGHGTTMDVTRAVEEVRTHHRERARAAFRALRTVEEPTPWAVARALFGEMDGIHVKFGAGEAAAHLDRLAALDIVERTGENPIRYRPRVEDYPSDLNLTP
ncbi:MBL fold metallo-hydrolase [Halalkalicoccus sp. NIPERK01]|uniref:MBL fold metallo-hydrolase n=1 Tax=Halalkalicoccus sp. NIPERK01 TaxID=3053469 RepID=UPI00256F2B1D|nr:MBL fold metallo-hydrolase [Halalkalicoccus sp. NIPERK01]MDL5360506.1 MBL fold metallo-hydrolase [Halalkalicoccus sp. NIPERK01]